MKDLIVFDLVISCDPLTPPNNGRFRSPPQTSYESVLSVECTEGYFLTGENSLQCVDDDNNGIGEWNKRLPTCQCEEI